MPEPELVLCLNAGSSSLKFALFRTDPRDETCLAHGSVEGLGSAGARARLRVNEATTEQPCPHADAQQALSAAFALLDAQGLPAATVVGHRVVHGGPAHLRPTRVDPPLIAELRRLVPLAPLHLPGGLAGIEAALARLPQVPHVACFDTSFHAQLPEHAARIPLPRELLGTSVRRYGFHGLSYEYTLSTLGTPLPERIIVAHLGNGASLAAIAGGRSVDTTMGFTPTGGILMGTRSGDLDPGLLFYLMREQGHSAESLERLLNHDSGLRAVGGSADVRLLSERQGQDENARLALTMLAYAVRKTIGSYVAVLGGLDTLVFTGGIGEHSPTVREQACAGLHALGVRLDPTKNIANAREIQAPGSCPVLVIAADEDRMIARHSHALLRASVAAPE